MLSAVNRLVDATDHRLVARRGRKGRSGPVVVSLVQDPARSGWPPKAAVVVPKKLGSAPARNLVQRRVRHLLRDRVGVLPTGSLTVVRLEPAAAGLTSAALATHLDAGLQTVVAAAARGRGR